MGFVKRFKSSRSLSSKSAKQKSKRLAVAAASVPPKLPSEKQQFLVVDDRGSSSSSCCTSVSLATGSFSSSGVFSIKQSFYGSGGRSPSPLSNATASVGSFSDVDEGEGGDGQYHHDGSLEEDSKLSPIKEVPLVSMRMRMPSRVFLRTADLPDMMEASLRSRHSSFSELADHELVDHVHRPSSNPPLPSMEDDPNESWVALDDGNGRKSPLAGAAVQSLIKTALAASMDRDMWTANGGTAKLLKSGTWDDTAFAPLEQRRAVPVPHGRGSRGENDVLVWSGSWSHGYYGHELPAIRCEAIVNMSPKALADLLMDSSRVKEYNKMSIGREDILVLHEDEERVVTKVSVGRSRPPMLGKTLVLKNLLHMEELPGGGDVEGYVLVSRAVAHADDDEAAKDPKVIHSEMLMGLNVVRAVEGEPDRCVLINLNHLRSPMIPMMFAKKLGLGAAVNFINDIRALC